MQLVSSFVRRLFALGRRRLLVVVGLAVCGMLAGCPAQPPAKRAAPLTNNVPPGPSVLPAADATPPASTAGEGVPAVAAQPQPDAARTSALVARLRAAGVNVEVDEQGEIVALVMGFTELGDEILPELTRFPHLQLLTADHTNITDAGLLHVGKLKSLKVLDLAANALTSAGLQHLSGLVQLERLHLGEMPVGDDVLPHLAGMKKLQLLTLTDTQVTLPAIAKFSAPLPHLEVVGPFGRLVGGRRLTLDPATDDAVLAELSSLPSLRELNLTECSSITDAGLDHVRQLTQLTALELGFTKITDDGLERLRTIRSLQRLDVRDTAISLPAVLQLAAALPELQVLASFGSLENETQLTLAPTAEDALLPHVRHLPNLQSLRLWRCDRLTDDALAPLAKCGELRVLNLGATNLGDAALERLKSLPKLQQLVLANSHVTDAGLPAIASLPQLRQLDLSATAISDRELATLAALRELRALDLSTTAVTDAGLPALAACDKLESLALAECLITGKQLATLAGLARLESLDLSLTLIGDDALDALSALPHLQRLELSGTLVTDAGIAKLHACKNLRYVGLLGAAVGPQAIAALRQALPAAEVAASVTSGPAAEEQ